MEMRRRCRRARDRGTQGPRNTGTALVEAGRGEKAVSLGELGCRMGPFMTQKHRSLYIVSWHACFLPP